MKKNIIIFGLTICSFGLISSCKKSSFDEMYRDPSKVTEVTVPQQFAGMIYSYRQLIIPEYRNIFVTLRPTIFRYLQITGWFNEPNHLVPGGEGINDRWKRYYEGLSQFRELETAYDKLPESEKQELRIYYLAAKILFYDQTQQTVDVHGDIPWSEAGMLSRNQSDYLNSYPAYDKATDIYKTMLDDLKEISTELNSLVVPANIQNKLSSQDMINYGEVEQWKRYSNSLRLRMLTRVSASTEFSSRATQELAEIINNQGTYPLILENEQNSQLRIFNLDDNNINTKGIRDAFEASGWYANLASKVIIDNMKQNADPRLPFMFEPGANASGVYTGLDQSLTNAVQNQQATNGLISVYNRSTFSRNQYFPGILFSASETQFLLAEHYLKTGNPAAAKTAFETGIEESIELYKNIRGVSNDNTVLAPAAPTVTQIETYKTNINWTDASNKLNLIATQKWLHFNIIQTVQAWSEVRRLDYPTFSFVVQNADIQKTVPVKFNLPAQESTYNLENYNAVKDQDNVNTKLFWDVQ